MAPSTSRNNMNKIRAEAAARTRATRSFDVTNNNQTITLRSGNSLPIRPPPSNRVGEVYQRQSTGMTMTQPDSTNASRSLTAKPKTPMKRSARGTAAASCEANNNSEAKADINGRIKKPASRPAISQNAAQINRAKKRAEAIQRGMAQQEKESQEKASASKPTASRGRLRRQKSQLTIIAVEDGGDRLEKADGAFERNAGKRIRERKGDDFDLAGISGAARDVRNGKKGKYTVGMKMVDVSDSDDDYDEEMPVSYKYERMIL